MLSGYAKRRSKGAKETPPGVWPSGGGVSSVWRDESNSLLRLIAAVRVLPVRQVQFTSLDGFRNRSLLCLVECAIVVRVILRDVRIHFGDMGEYHLGVRLLSVRRRVCRKLQRAICNGLGERFFFRRVKLPVLVPVEDRDFGEDFGHMFHGRGAMLQGAERVLSVQML